MELPLDLTTLDGAKAWLDEVKQLAAKMLARDGEITASGIFVCRRNPKTGLSFPRPKSWAVAIPPQWLANADVKDQLADLIRRYAWRGHAIGLILLTESWALRYDRPVGEDAEVSREKLKREYFDGLWEGRLGAHPNRIEVAHIFVQHRAGLAGATYAEIVRDQANRPSLAGWTEVVDDVSGRFTDLLPPGET